jgi:predicted peptidase
MLIMQHDEIQKLEPCFIFCPKCKDAWGGAAWGGTYDLGTGAYPGDLRPPTASALSIIDSLKNIYPIDTNRIIIYGGSMGAEGVFILLAKKSAMFAGALAIAGYTLRSAQTRCPKLLYGYYTAEMTNSGMVP